MTTQDKLAEALLARIQKAWEAHSEDGKVSISMRDAMELCEQVLPTVIQQAQPPAASLSASEIEWLQYTVAHMEEDSEPEDRQCARVIRGLLARIGAAGEGDITNPPAASVTDAMIMRAVKAWTSNGFGNPGQVFSIYSVAKVMLEAALAAQENPNG